ncbi:MAG TPA: response regulator [Candidatus Sulfotelmatobacter sp.]|nr:response regulator [Candidatus Sulfotelmatobacter sp.]
MDDEPLVLEVLKLTLEFAEGEWEAMVAHSGEEALALITKQRFDIVISDMRMSGMTGAQLLNEVMKRSPTTIRIILSGYADEDEIFHCVGATHQFLGKPFELSALAATLKRINGLKARLRSPEIQKLLTRKEALPSIPDVYFKILEAIQAPSNPTQQIAEIVASDPALTARMLQLVNSAFFGFAREVSGVDEAVMLLGVGTIRSLVLAMHLFSAFNVPPSGNSPLHQVWSHSGRVAQLARKIVSLEGGDAKLQEQAFTAGLLHDIGKLILADNLSAKYLEILAQARQARRPLVEVERQELQATHAELGGFLLDLWGLPAPLVEAVALHHEPACADPVAFGPLTAVHAANVLEWELSGSAGDPAAPQLDLEYLRRLNLEDRVEFWRSKLADL